ncbi:beta strand repeat-containing protein, partial [Polynucleobacter asymbioticus]
NTYSLNLQNTASGLVVNNSGTLIGAANIGINTLNLSGSNAVVAGSITGSSSSAVNVLGNFSSGGDIAVGAVNISNTGALTLNNNVNVNTGTLTNAGNLIVTAGITPIITGNYAQSGKYSVGITGPTNYGQLHIIGDANFTSGYSFGITPGSVVTTGTYGSILDATGTIGGFSAYNGIYHYSGLTTAYSVTGDIAPNELDLIYGTTTGYGQLVFNTSTYTGDVGFASYHNGVLINSGVSVGGNSYGIYINSGGSIDGGITNSGTLVGTSYAGILIGNNSTLGGTLGGLYGAGIQNLAGSTIAGGQYGIAIQSGGVVTRGITNAGSILGVSAGLLISSSSRLTGGLTNTGLIASQGWAGVVVNSGATVAGGIFNTGTILAANYGVDVFDGGNVLGGITNTGTIVTSQGGPFPMGAIFVGAGIVSGGISNSGLINGASSSGVLAINNGYIDSINNQSLSGSQVGTIAGG